MRISRTGTNEHLLLTLRKTFILVDERWFRTYLTDAFGSVNDCYMGQVLDDVYNERLGVPTKTYEVFEELH